MVNDRERAILVNQLMLNVKSKGFTTLAVIDPHMHQPEEAQAILGLFDGEIRIIEQESDKERRKLLRIVSCTTKLILKTR